MTDFGHQTPYNMNVVPDGAFRSYAKDHILVHRNIDHDVAEPKTQRPAHDGYGVIRWIEDFVYKHLGKPETSARIGISEANEFKVSRNRETVTGNWELTNSPRGQDAGPHDAHTFAHMPKSQLL